MEKEKKGRHDKTDEDLRESLYTTVKISKYKNRILTKFSKENRLTKQDVLDQLIAPLAKPGMTLAALDDKYELYQMNNQLKSNHLEITSNIRKLENGLLRAIEKNNDNNLDFLKNTVTEILAFTKMLALEAKKNILFEQHHEILKSFIIDVRGKEKASTIFENARLSMEETEKNKLNKPTSETKKENPPVDRRKYFCIEGKVSTPPNINILASSNLLYCTLSLAKISSTHTGIVPSKVILEEGELTQKMKLTSHENIREYFSKINKEDSLKLKGYNSLIDVNNNIGGINNNIAFIVSEVLEHIPYIPKN